MLLTMFIASKRSLLLYERTAEFLNDSELTGIGLPSPAQYPPTDE